MQRMRVLLLAPPLGRQGGIQRYVRTLARALQETLGAENVRLVPMGESSNVWGKRRVRRHAKWGFAARVLWHNARWRSDLTICGHVALAPVGWLLKRLKRQPYWVIVYVIEAWRPLPYVKRMSLRRA